MRIAEECGNMMGRNHGMWDHFSCERSTAKKFRQLAGEEKQAGMADGIASQRVFGASEMLS